MGINNDDSKNNSPTKKVFGIGVQKTGTTSLGKALENFGYEVCHRNFGLDFSVVDSNLTTQTDATTQEFNGFQDNPWCMLYERYSVMYPDAFFVLTVRGLPRWLNSMGIFGKRNIPMFNVLFDADCFKGNEKKFARGFERHTENVINYFSGQPGRLLVLDIEQSPTNSIQALSGFLGHGFSEQEFPKANVGRRNKVRWAFSRYRWLRTE